MSMLMVSAPERVCTEVLEGGVPAGASAEVQRQFADCVIQYMPVSLEPASYILIWVLLVVAGTVGFLMAARVWRRGGWLEASVVCVLVTAGAFVSALWLVHTVLLTLATGAV